MRHVLYESRENFIPLKKEIEFVKNFIDLQRIRLNKKVDVKFNITGTINNKLIIPLIFEPFIDNAFKHGCYSDVDNAFIQILINIEDNHLLFNISNTYDPESQDLKPKNKASGIGLENARRRLEYLYKKDEFNLDISKKENIFRVELKLALKDK
jgi:LytS/YehU family sensor histidine kinase